ncbi:MAG: hypothetical protein JW751_29950 [Polyangiaceae bacterium]|nr:hypothetical protein [Polyangiaceae bacterium]
MPDAVQTFLEAKGLGHVERRIPLGGRLDVGGAAAVPWLCVTRTGPVLVGALGDGRGRMVPLADCEHVRYVRGRFRPALEIDGESYKVPLAQRSAVERTLALARLRTKDGEPEVKIPIGPGIERPGEVERAWITASLAPNELLLAWVRSVTQAPIATDGGEDLSGRWRLLVTDQRIALVALSILGHAASREVPPDDLPTEPLPPGRQELTLADVDLVFHRSSSDAIHHAIALARLDPAARRREAARRAWVTGRPDQLPFVRAALQTACAVHEPLAEIVVLLVSAERNEPPMCSVDVGATLHTLAQEDAEPDALARLAADWGFSRTATRAVLDDLRRHGIRSEPWALRLHRQLHDDPPDSRDPIRGTLADLDFAEHSLDADLRPLAVAVLETRLAHLPSETLDELLPPRDADLTTDAGGPTLRSRVFELLARARGTPEAPDVRAIAELARLHPLVSERVRALAKVAQGELGERAKAVGRALEPGGLSPRPTAEGGLVLRHRSLSDKQLDEVLRHSATRRDSPLLSRLQALLASVPVPDVSMLRDYCEQVTAPPYDAAVRAFADATTLLGLGGLQAYVSRGAKGVGVRAYEGRPPFVLIGFQHLVPGDYALSETELRFALGAELAHLRFGHSRVTSSEVWNGALDKGKQGVELALGLVPVLRGWALADKAVRVTSKVPIPAVQRVVDAAQTLQRRVVASTVRGATGHDDGLSTLNETLVVAHRMMQLSADRAGLVIAGDVQASLRAMFLLRRDYRAEFDVVEARGLAPVLSQRAEDGHIAYQDLAIRVAALLAFYLSDEYLRLRSALLT